MADLTLDAIAAVAANERGALATTLLAAEARRGGEVWAPLCGEPFGPGMEAIYEGYLLHYGRRGCSPRATTASACCAATTSTPRASCGSRRSATSRPSTRSRA